MRSVYLLALVVASLINSKQAAGQKGWSLSVVSTPQFSFLNNSDDRDSSKIDQRATFRVNFGAGVAYHFTSNAGIGLDVLYSLQGQRYKISGKETNQKQAYLKIPLYFVYTSNASQSVSFIGKIGPQLSILTNSKLTDGMDNDINSDTEDWYKEVTVGGMIGGGTQFRLNSSLFLTTIARFDYDFTNAEDDGSKHWPKGRAETHNITTGLEIGLKFMLR